MVIQHFQTTQRLKTFETDEPRQVLELLGYFQREICSAADQASLGMHIQDLPECRKGARVDIMLCTVLVGESYRLG